ncbi:putative zip metal ion [Phaeomoniella chlamydospora]|uniref:Putative zip metal ion n=1 Tax=Phaeomoniella chlamydospora TaxID=158046 RepID=A0A0G2ENX8_PHACM|nr:putative zip metal ion [Phaeomoniella chlamydospora]
MGVLVGTSLIVIIPEGVETLYSAQSTGVAHTRRSLNHRALVDVRSAEPESDWLNIRDPADDGIFNLPGPVRPNGNDVDPPKTPTDPGVIGALGGTATDSDSPTSTEKDSHHEEQHSSPHAWVGVALITGFILMFLIDKLPHHIHVSKPAQHRYHIALNELGRGFQRSSVDDEQEAFGGQSQAQQTRSFATTTGLVIHAAADGIALGASSSAENTGLSFIIFLAIMVHKAPAAFGLTSVLLKQGLSKRVARGHLVLFSLAAPVGAILTWTLSAFIGFGGLANEQNRGWWTGMLLLFSGGTFLYVAMQTMQEVGSSYGDKHIDGQANGYLDGRDQRQEPQKPEIRDLMAAVFGMILPLFLQVGHAH